MTGTAAFPERALVIGVEIGFVIGSETIEFEVAELSELIDEKTEGLLDVELACAAGLATAAAGLSCAAGLATAAAGLLTAALTSTAGLALLAVALTSTAGLRLVPDFQSESAYRSHFGRLATFQSPDFWKSS